MTKKERSLLNGIGERLRNQDNCGTEHPIYMVQQIEYLFGVDPSLHDVQYLLLDEDGDVVATESSPGLYAPHGSKWVTRAEHWMFVEGAVAFTKDGIQDYLRQNAHNLNQPRIWVGSLSRVGEMIKFREFLLHQGEMREQDNE